MRVAAGDVNGDGSPDIITAPGPGRPPEVKVFSGVSQELLSSFFAYDSNFTGGVFVAAGDINGYGKAEIITGPDAGGSPHVKVFDGVTGAELLSFFAYDPSFTGGVRVAAGDINGDGRSHIVTGPGPGRIGPQIEIFDAATGIEFFHFSAYDPAFLGGVNVAAGDVNGDGKGDIITGAGEGLGEVRAFGGIFNHDPPSFSLCFLISNKINCIEDQFEWRQIGL